MAETLLDALSEPAREFISRTPQPLLIGGERSQAADGRTFETIDPATGEHDLRRSPRAAPRTSSARSPPRAAALDGPLRKLNPAKRSALMNALAELIKANGEQLAQIESLDNGKPVPTAGGDVAAAVNHLRYYAGWPTKIEGETIPVSARDVLCYTLREPVGRVRADRAVELPAADGRLEDRPGARRRLPDRAEAGRADAADARCASASWRSRRASRRAR